MTTRTDEDDRLVAGRYRLADKLGSGGMGVVWRAYDERLHRQVAIKQLRLPAGLTEEEAAQAKQKVMREGRIAAKLQHPHAIMVYDVAEDHGEPFLVMEYLRSKSLADVLAERRTIEPTEAARIGADVANALAAAHSAGVVHRDVKPGNILLGDDGVIKITDFGISRAVEDVTGTLTSVIVGTPAYLSPEVARGDRAGFASDVYSLGSTLYAAVEGEPPFGFADNAIALLYRVSSGQFEPPTHAGALTDVLVSLLRTDPAQRPTMAEAAVTLAAAARDGRDADAETVAVADETTGRIPPPRRRTSVLPPVAPTAVEPLGHDEALEPEEDGQRAEPAPAAPARPSRETDRRKRLAIFTAAAIAILAIGAALLAAVNRDPQGTAAPAATSSAPAATSQSTTAEPTSAAGQPPAQTTTQQPPPPTSPPPTAVPPPATDAGSPQEALVDYYALMPGNLDEAWTLLTPKYQVSPAGGIEGYRRFWSRIATVRISEVTPISGGRVDATIVYNFKDGRVVRERHAYNLVLDKDRWLIDTSRVISSVTL